MYCNVNFFEVVIDVLQVIVRVSVEIIRLFEIIIVCLSSNILSTNPVGSNKSIYAFHPIPDITILNVSNLECCID